MKKPCQFSDSGLPNLQEVAAALEGLLRVWSSVQSVRRPTVPPLVGCSGLNIPISPDSSSPITSLQQRAAVAVSKCVPVSVSECIRVSEHGNVTQHITVSQMPSDFSCLEDWCMSHTSCSWVVLL